MLRIQRLQYGCRSRRKRGAVIIGPYPEKRGDVGSYSQLHAHAFGDFMAVSRATRYHEDEFGMYSCAAFNAPAPSCAGAYVARGAPASIAASHTHKKIVVDGEDRFRRKGGLDG